MKKRIKVSWLKLTVNVLGFIPLAVIGYLAFHNGLGPNPILRSEQLIGDVALIMLLLCLTVTPVVTLSGQAWLSKLRRTLGLLAFYYAFVHVLIFTWLDYGFMWNQIFDLLFHKQFLLFGLPAFVLLVLLAITSLKFWKIQLGIWWKRIHRLVYLAAILVVIHYGLSVKGSLFLLRGAIWKSLVALAYLAIILLLRVPLIHRAILSLRNRLKR
jgi:sulfoxide reductase heme-binding subunit YedZ